MGRRFKLNLTHELSKPFRVNPGMLVFCVVVIYIHNHAVRPDKASVIANVAFKDRICIDPGLGFNKVSLTCHRDLTGIARIELITGKS